MNSFPAIFFASLYCASAIFCANACSNRVTATNTPTTFITKVSYSSTGGRSGNYESLAISADSLIYLQASRGEEKTTKEKTTKDFWGRLTKTINLKDFDKIKSDPGHSLYDGIDVTITIESSGKEHSIVNGNEDTANYKRIRPFTNLLEKKLAELGKKIVW